MYITQDVQYDYKQHMDEPVKLRLVHDCNNYYNLEFCLLNSSKEKWHPVQEYHRTLDGYEPGARGTFCISGNWTNRWFEVKNLDDAKAKLEDFRSRIKTVGDIYNKFIKRCISDREADMEAYRKKMEREAALPDCIE